MAMAEKAAAETEQKFSVMSHQLVPTHTLLNEKEEAEVLARYKTSKDALPSSFERLR